MQIELVAPELRGPMRRVRALNAESRITRRIMRAAIRIMPAGKVDGVTIEKRRAGFGVRLYRPAEPRSDAALLFIHGGGYVIGGATVNDRMCGEIAAALGITVVSPEYRKAPEHPYPAPLDDVNAAWTWLQGAADELGVNRRRVVIGGESAGGGLAAALVARLNDEGATRPLGQLLFCPMLDDRTAADRDLDRVDHFVWNNRQNRFGWWSYLGTEPGGSDVPAYAAPARRADLAGLPPAWIGYSTIELFGAEDRAYATRLREAGVPVVEDVVEGAPHGFEIWAFETPLARRHRAAAISWLGSLLAEDG